MLKKIYSSFNNAEMNKLIGSLLLVEAIFSIHHIYGEYHVYHDGLHIMSVYISLPILLITIGFLWLTMKKEASIFKWAAIGIILMIWVGFVGVVEGGGFHLLENFLFLVKVPDATLIKFFPKLPSGNFVNELTGLFEFISVFPLFIHTWRLIKSES